MPIGGGVQAPDLEKGISALLGDFENYVRSRTQSQLTGNVGLQAPQVQPPIAPPQLSPVAQYERAGTSAAARREGIDRFMTQAAKQASQSFKPGTPDYMLGVAALALPLAAALIPEGHGRRGRRKSERWRNALLQIDNLVSQGLSARMGSFENKRQTEFEAAKERAARLGDVSNLQYQRDIGKIGLERDIKQKGLENRLALGRLGIATQGAKTAAQREKRLGIAQRNKQMGSETRTKSLTPKQKYDIAQKGILSNADAAVGRLSPELLVKAGLPSEFAIGRPSDIGYVNNRLLGLQDTTKTGGFWGIGKTTHITPAPDSTFVPYANRLDSLRREALGQPQPVQQTAAPIWQQWGYNSAAEARTALDEDFKAGRIDQNTYETFLQQLMR